MPAYDDSDLESVSTASCSDDDEIDEKAIRTMSCNFLQKKKSGVFEDIIAQKKASLHNMALLRQYSAMVSHQQQGGGGGGGGFTNRQQSFARKSSNDDNSTESVSRRIPAPPSSSSHSSNQVARKNSNDSQLGSRGASASPSTSVSGGDASYASQNQLLHRTSLSSVNDEASSSYPTTPRIGSDPTTPAKSAAGSSTTTRGRRQRTVGFGDGDGEATTVDTAAVTAQPPPAASEHVHHAPTGGDALEPKCTPLDNRTPTLQSQPGEGAVETPLGSLPSADSRGASWGNAAGAVSEALTATTTTVSPAAGPEEETPTTTVPPQAAAVVATTSDPSTHNRGTVEEESASTFTTTKTTTTTRTTRRTRGRQLEQQQEEDGAGEAPPGVAMSHATRTTTNADATPSSNEQPIVDFSNVSAGPTTVQVEPSDAQAATLKPHVSNARRQRRGPRRESNDATEGEGAVDVEERAATTEAAATVTTQEIVSEQPTTTATEVQQVAEVDAVPHPPSNGSAGRSRRAAARRRTSSLDGAVQPAATATTVEGSEASVIEARDGESSKRTPPTAKVAAVIQDSGSDTNEQHETPAGDDVEQPQRPRPTAGVTAAVPTLMSLQGLRLPNTEARSGGHQQRTISPSLPRRMSTTPASPQPDRIRENSDDSESGHNHPVKVTPLPKIDALSVVNMWGKSALGLGGLMNLKKLAPPETTSPTAMDHRDAADQCTPHPPSDGKHSTTPRNSIPSSSSTTTSPSAWSKAAFLTGGRREGPDATGLIDDDPYGTEGGSEEMSREAILKKEKALQQRMKALKNLVAPASVSLSARGPAKSPRQLTSLAARLKV